MFTPFAMLDSENTKIFATSPTDFSDTFNFFTCYSSINSILKRTIGKSGRLKYRLAEKKNEKGHIVVTSSSSNKIRFELNEKMRSAKKYKIKLNLIMSSLL